MTLPYYASAEQIMRDKTELARKGIARGRSVIVLVYDKGVLFVAENPSATLHKVSELYDRVGFAAVGKYNEFENLRRGGILQADLRGYQYDRRDVSGRALANAYAQTLGSIFTDQLKPYEVELCIAEVGYPEQSAPSVLYRITFDGSIVDEREFVVMGGTTEPITTALKSSYAAGLNLAAALGIAVKALQAGIPDTDKRTLGVASLEVATLEQARPRRAFRRIAHEQLQRLLDQTAEGGEASDAESAGAGDETSASE
ncbi:proteasome subunit alpha [Nocardia arizonensis]|uniref:proteasome subunit alpha n=1 Tax=Nocardia arizonensis TaxID=1141647 RepID=UPI0006D145A8|nr:proteasome subunit alpha [Nocardia arizonensis]